MKITVCIGSSCHVRGSRQVVEQLQDLIRKNGLGDEVELCGSFCIGNCQPGVCVTVDAAFRPVPPEGTAALFAEPVRKPLNKQ